MCLVAYFYQWMKWPGLFNWYAIGHGFFVIVWPIDTLIVYIVLITLRWLRRSNQDSK
jgi:hypothetical protein